MSPPPKNTGARFLVATLVGPEVLFTAVESIVVVYPLVDFIPTVRNHPELLGALVLAMIHWSVVLFGTLRRVVRGGERDSPEELYKLAQSLPGRAFMLRLSLWFLVGLVGSVYLVWRGAISSAEIFTVLTICLVHSLAVALIRWALQKRIIRTLLQMRNLHPPWLKLQADTLYDRLTEVAFVLGAVTATFLATFVFLFVPISTEQFLRMETFFPWTGVVMGALWYFLVAPRPVAPLMAYLKVAARDAKPDLDVYQQACRAVHRLPVVLGLSQICFFVLAGLMLFFQSLWLYDFTLIQALLVFCAVVIVTLGAGIYEMIWSRAVLRPVVAHLAAQPEAAQLSVRAFSLRFKMVISFGGAVVFTVMLALFWTFLQYGNLRREFAANQARREIATVLANLDTRAARGIRDQLSRQVPVQGSRYYYVPPGSSPPPPLPPSAVRTIRRGDAGMLELKDLGLAGAYAPIDRSRPELGSLLILLPLDTSAKVSLNLQVLLYFFIVVLVVSLGVVMLTSTELTHPLALLEQRATEMAGGKLDLRVLPEGEHDEIGRLTAAFELMRRALKEKIQTIERLNIGLEEKVKLRTGELERSNQELMDAISALQEAQQRLVTSEKLASVGQLVAGIAHEVNNPINAVVNTLEPLSDTVEQLMTGEDEERVAEAREELSAMLRVIRSGTRRTQKIVQALRNYSRKDDQERTPMDLHADIDETLALLQHNLKDVEVVRDFQARTDLSAFRGPLNQALMNLISNAAAAVEDREAPRVVIRTREDEQAVKIEVEDNGPGIPEEVRSKIFDPFFTTKEVGKGTGLGLSITHGIIEQHSGEISVESDGGGTTFTMKIPRHEA